MSDVNHFQILLDLTSYLNSTEKPKENFRAALSFLLTTSIVDADDLNDAMCEAFTQFEDEVLPARAAKVTGLLSKFQ